MSTNHSKDLRRVDSNTVPTVLAEFFETENFSSLSEDRIISLFDDLGEVNSDIVSQFMDFVIRKISSSSVLDPGIHPLTAEDKKREIVCSLCNPLSNLLLGVQEDLVYGSALCLEALVKSANWRFASDEIVNKVCLKVADALAEKPTQTNAHMTLAVALVKHSSLIIDPHATSFVRSGLRILNDGIEDSDLHKQLAAIQMVHLFLMKCVDPVIVFSEIDTDPVIVFSEIDPVLKKTAKYYSDQMELVRRASFEAMQTARGKGSSLEDSASISESNVAGSNCRNEIVHGLKEGSLVSTLPAYRSAAVCLEALVRSELWRFASDEIIHEICVTAAVALEEKHPHIIDQMNLVMALTTHNRSITALYARSLVQSGMQIVNDGIDEKNYTQKQLSAIQMVNMLLKYVPRSVFSELKTLAALEAMQTAGEGSRLDMAFPTVPASSNVEVIHAVPIDGLITTTSASSIPEAAAVRNFNIRKKLFKKDVTSNRFTLTKSSVEAHLLPLLQDAQNVELENLRPITLLLVDDDNPGHITHEVELSKIGGRNYALTGVKRALTQKQGLNIGDEVAFRYDEVQLRLQFKLVQRR